MHISPGSTEGSHPHKNLETSSNRDLIRLRGGWLKWISFGITSDMPFEERRIIYVLNASCINLVFFGFLFLILNLISKNGIPSFYNLGNLLMGITGWTFLLFHQHRLGLLFLLSGTTLVFFFGGWFFTNNAELLLIVNIVVILLVLRDQWLRWGLALLAANGFLAVQIIQYQQIHGPLSLMRYTFNTVLFLIWLIFLAEMFHRLEFRYIAVLNKRNLSLRSQRLQLEREHKRLISLTRELRASNRVRERLLSIISHDFRSPLAGLQMSLDALARGDLDREEFIFLSQEIGHDLHHISSNLEGLLTWSAWQIREGKESLNLQLVKLFDVVQEVFDLLLRVAQSKQISMENTVHADVEVTADPDALRIILRNLLSNALKFSPVGGKVNVESTVWEKNGNFEVCSVTDSGEGVPKHMIGELKGEMRFVSQPGTRGEKGFGLGLEISSELIVQQGGRLWVENLPEKGAQFAFILKRNGMAGS